MTNSYWVLSLGLELCLVKEWRGELNRHGLCLHGIQTLVWGVGNRPLKSQLQCKVLILELVCFCDCWVAHRNLAQRTLARGVWALEFQTADLQLINILTLGKLPHSLSLFLYLNKKRLNKGTVISVMIWWILCLLSSPLFFFFFKEAETQSHFFRFSNSLPGTLGNENTLILNPVLESRCPY